MVDHLNVNDPAFPGDWIYNDDYKRDLNAHEEALRLHAREHWLQFAVINEGLTVEDSTTSPGTKLMVRAGIARDLDKYPVFVPIDVDGVVPVDPGGGWNYVAVRHAWAYSGPAATVKTGLPYNRVRADSYEINVAAVAHNEALGWVRLCRVKRSGAIWIFDFNQPWRSRFGQYGIVSWTFGYVGVVPLGPGLMSHQGLALELWTAPVDINLCKMTITAQIAGANDCLATARVGGAPTALAVTLVGTTLGPTTTFLPTGTVCPIDALMGVEIGSAGGPTNVGVTLAGYIIRGLA